MPKGEPRVSSEAPNTAKAQSALARQGQKKRNGDDGTGGLFRRCVSELHKVGPKSGSHSLWAIPRKFAAPTPGHKLPAPTEGVAPGFRSVSHSPVEPGFLLKSYPAQAQDFVAPVSSQDRDLQHRRERDPCPHPARSRRADPTARDPHRAERLACVERPEANPASEASCPDVGLASGNRSGRGRRRGQGSQAFEGSSGRGPGALEGSLVRRVQDSLARERPCGV